MDKHFLYLRERLKRRRYEKLRIRKKWTGFGTGLKAVLKYLFIVLQIAVILVGYAVLAYYCPLFFYICLGLTAAACFGVIIFEPDVQSKISWTALFLVSFGSGAIIYFISRPYVCFFRHKVYFSKINKRVGKLQNGFTISKSEASDTERYLQDNGFQTFTGTELKYYSNARRIMDNMIARIDAAEKFVFIEFFIIADGVFLERLISIFRRKSAEGVKIYMLYDDIGSAGVFSDFIKKELKSAGVRIKAFNKIFSPFYFGLNYRDHRKVVVVDGKTGYIGGYNLIDDCANQSKLEGVWKDSGLRLDGAAVDGLSLQFIKQWRLATREKLDAAQFTGLFTPEENPSHITVYSGGPEADKYVCRGVYSSLINSAKERLYIMSPYLVPDSKLFGQIAKKAKEGVDVRIILPGAPDYKTIYRVTAANARRLMKKGVKVWYASGAFVHSKVMLTESQATVSTVNMDMRAFYQEFDNGGLTNDSRVLAEIEEDFNEIFSRNAQAEIKRVNPFGAIYTAILKLFSPLM